MSTLRLAAESHYVTDLLKRAGRLAREGNVSGAGELLDQAWEAGRMLEGSLFRASCWRRVATLYRVIGRGEPASRCRQLALAAELREQGRPSGVSLWLAACEAREHGRCDEAARLLDASAACEPAARRGDVLAERGRLCRARGDLPGAIEFLRKSARLLIRADDAFCAARVLEELGTAACEDQRFRTGALALRGAAERYRGMGRVEDARRATSAARVAESWRGVLEMAAERN